MSSTHFCDSSYRFRDIKILNIVPSKSKTRSQSAILAIIPFDGKCQNLRLSPLHICANSYRFRYIKNLNFFYLQKVGHSHRVQFSQLHHSMANGKIYKRNFLHFSFSLRCDLITIVTGRQRHTENTDRNGQAPGYRKKRD